MDHSFRNFGFDRQANRATGCLRLLCRNFEESSAGVSTGGGNVATSCERPSAYAISRLFNPRRSRTQSRNSKKRNARTWSFQFVCLVDKYQCKIPTATKKQTLQKAGLWVKKIKLQWDDDETSEHHELISDEKDEASDAKDFPQFRDVGVTLSSKTAET